ncbi:MAG: cation diffusion facilitator family transporter [Hyphomicrobiaceae bacterium]
MAPTTAPSTARTRRRAIAIGSIVVACLVMALKYAAYLRTGSVALYSDALESIVNVTTALIALFALEVARRPADRQHQFGHHKAEYFSAVIEGVLIVIAALLIVREAYDALIRPRPIESTGTGLLINGLATALNAIWAWFLVTRGKTLRSPALVADGWHLATDVATSLGVIVGLLAAALTGFAVLDPALAILVALNILWAGWRLMTKSISGLMDEAVASDVARRIRAVISDKAEGALEAHDLKTRSAGSATFIEFHLVVPGDFTVSKAHGICDRIEHALKEEIEGAEILIHVEPEGEAQHAGVPVL